MIMYEQYLKNFPNFGPAHLNDKFNIYRIAKVKNPKI